MTAVTMDVADLVKQMSENLEAIHAAVAGLSTTEHEAKLDELEQKRDTLLGDLKAEYDTEKEDLAARRKQEEEAVAEARRKEDEEREARRKAEDEEVRKRIEGEDAERLGKFDEETKRVEDEADDGMDAVEAEVQKLLAEGEARLRELEEKRKDINRRLEEQMSAPLPTVVPRKRARDKAAAAAAAAAAAVGVAAGVDAAADASAEAAAEPAPNADATAKEDGPTDATADDAKPEDAPPAEAAPAEADAPENKENSKSEVSSSPSFDLDEQGSNDAKANDGSAAPASEEAEEGPGDDTDADAGPGTSAEIDETAEAVKEEDNQDTKEEDAEERSKEDDLKEEETGAEASAEDVAAEADKAVEEEPTVEPEVAPPAEDANDEVSARSLEVPEPAPDAPADDATPKDEAEDIPNYYDTTSPTIPQNDTSPVPNDDFELSPTADDAANETEEPISKEVIEETAEEAAAPSEEAVMAVAAVEPETEADVPATVEEPEVEDEAQEPVEEVAVEATDSVEEEAVVAASVEAEAPAAVEEPLPEALEPEIEEAPAAFDEPAVNATEPAADASEAAEGPNTSADADLAVEAVHEEAKPESLDADEPAPVVNADSATAEVEPLDGNEAKVVDMTTEALEVAEVPEPAVEEAVQSEDTPEPATGDADVAAPPDTPEPTVEVPEPSETVDDAEKDRSLDVEPAGDEPSSVETEAAEPAVKETVTDEPTVEEPALEEAVVEQPAADEAVDRSIIQEAASEEPTFSASAIGETAARPATDEPVTEEPSIEEAAIEKEAAEEPAVDLFVAGEPTDDEPITENTDTEEPAAEEPAAEEPAAEEPAAEDAQTSEGTATKEVLSGQEPAVDVEISRVPLGTEDSTNQEDAQASKPSEPVAEAGVLATDSAAAEIVSDDADITVDDAVEEQASAAEAVVEAQQPESDEPVAESAAAEETTGADEGETVTESRAVDLHADEAVDSPASEAVPADEASVKDTPSDDVPPSEKPSAEVTEVSSVEGAPVSDLTAVRGEPSEVKSDDEVLPSDEAAVAIQPDVLTSDDVATAIDASEDGPAETTANAIAEVETTPAMDELPRDLDAEASELPVIVDKAEAADDDNPASEIATTDNTGTEAAAVEEATDLEVDAELKSDDLAASQVDAVMEGEDDTGSVVLDAPDKDTESVNAEPVDLDARDISEDVKSMPAEGPDDQVAATTIGETIEEVDVVQPAASTDAQPEGVTAEEPKLSESIATDRSLDTATLNEAETPSDPFSDAAALSDNDAVAEAEVEAPAQDDAASVQTALADEEQAPAALSQLEVTEEPDSPLVSAADAAKSSNLADGPSDALELDKDDNSIEETPAAEAALDTSVLSDAPDATTLDDGHSAEGDAAAPLAGRDLPPAEAQESSAKIPAEEATLDRHDTLKSESDHVDGPQTDIAAEAAISAADLDVPEDPEPAVTSRGDVEEDSDDEIEVLVKPDTVDSQATLVNGANSPAAIKSIEEPPLSPQSDAGSDAHDEDSFLGTREGGDSVEEAGLAFEKHHDTHDVSPSPGEDEGQHLTADRNSSTLESVLTTSIAADKPDTPNTAIQFDDAGADSAGDDHLTDSEDESPFGLSVPGTQDRSLASSSFVSNPETQEEGRASPEISFQSSDRALVDDFVEASRPSTPSEYGEGSHTVPKGHSQMDASAASGDQDSIASSPLIESPYDLDDFVEDVATKQPLSPLPEADDEDINPFFADEAATLVNGHRDQDDSPSHTFRGGMDEPESPAEEEDVQEDPFDLSYETRHESNLAKHDEPSGEPIVTTDAAVDKQPFDFRFDETSSNVAAASAERDQVAVSGLGLNTFDRGVSHQEQDEFSQLVSRDNNPFRVSSRGSAEDTSTTRGIRYNDVKTEGAFGRPKTFDPWDRQKSPELVQRGFGEPSPTQRESSLEHLNAPDLTARSWTPAESPPVSPYRAASPDFKPWGTSSKPTSPTLSQKWAPIGSNTDDLNSQGGWGGLPSARQQPALAFSPAPALAPSTADNNLGYRRSEYSYEDDSEGSDYEKEPKQDNRSSNGSLQEQFNGYRIKEQTIRVVDQDAEGSQSALSTPRVCAPAPKLAPQSSSRDPLPSPLRLRHEPSIEALPAPTSPRRNPFARAEPPRPETPPSQAPEEDFDPEMFMPRDVTNVPWHERTDSAPISLRSQSTLSSSPSSPVHSALHADKNEPVIRDSWPARPRNDSNLTDANAPEYDPFRQDTKTYQEPTLPVSQRWPTSTSIPTTNNASPGRTAVNESPGSMFQKMRSIFENQGQGSPTRGRAGTDTSSPTRSRPVSGVWVPVRQSRQFATGAQVWESAFGDGRGRAGQRGDPDEPDERDSLLQDSH